MSQFGDGTFEHPERSLRDLAAAFEWREKKIAALTSERDETLLRLQIATAKLADDPQPSSDSPDYARALEIHIHLLRAELADERAKKSDALIAAADDIERLAAERDALRAALDEYGEHQGVCPKKYHGMKDARPCTCGFDEAAKEGA